MRPLLFRNLWPTATLSFSAAQGFNSVIVHYGAPPPAGGDHGTIFMADNMNVTPAVPEPEIYVMMMGGLGLMGFAVRRRKLKWPRSGASRRARDSV